QLVVELARREHTLFEAGQELDLRFGRHVERMHHATAREIGEQRLPQHGVVVAIVQRARAGEEVEVGTPAAVVQKRPVRPIEDSREGATVSPYLGFHSLDDLHTRPFSGPIRSKFSSGWGASNSAAQKSGP